MLLGIVEFMKANWLWLTCGLIVVICIIVLICTGGKDKEKKEGESETSPASDASEDASVGQDSVPDRIDSETAVSESAEPEPVFSVIDSAPEPIAEESAEESSEEGFREQSDEKSIASESAQESEPEEILSEPVYENSVVPVEEPANAGKNEEAAFEEAVSEEVEPAESKESKSVKSAVKAAKPAAKAANAKSEDVDEEDHNDVVVKHPDSEKRSTGGYRVVYDRENFSWVVKKDNNTRVTRRVKTKKEALEIAKELCKKQDTSMTVHKKDGKFQKK